MPGYKRSRKYTAEQEGMFKIRVLDILNSSENSLTIDDIKAQDPLNLGPVTTQKISRVLGHLGDMGLVVKSKSKSTGRMMYKTVSKMIEQGYEVEEVVSFTPTRNRNYELEAELRLKEEDI